MFPGISRNETRYMYNTVMPEFEGKISSEAAEHGLALPRGCVEHQPVPRLLRR